MLKYHCLSPQKECKEECRSRICWVWYFFHVIAEPVGCVLVVYSQFVEFFVDSPLFCHQTPADVGTGKMMLGCGCTDSQETAVGMRGHGSDRPGNVRCFLGHLDVPALLCCWSGSHKYWNINQL